MQQQYRHAGIQFMMSKLREKYWIMQGRRAVRKVVSSCVKCRRFTTKPAEVPETALPEDRVRTAKAFEVTGVDLAGPLFLQDGSKVWLVLYTCAVYRAVHLELVTSLSTEEFILAFIRFIGREDGPALSTAITELILLGPTTCSRLLIGKKWNWKPKSSRYNGSLFLPQRRGGVD